MKISYDPDADAMYIQLRDVKSDYTKEVAEDIIIDYTKSGEIVGVELLFVKEKNPDVLKKFSFEKLLAT